MGPADRSRRVVPTAGLVSASSQRRRSKTAAVGPGLGTGLGRRRQGARRHEGWTILMLCARTLLKTVIGLAAADNLRPKKPGGRAESGRITPGVRRKC